MKTASHACERSVDLNSGHLAMVSTVEKRILCYGDSNTWGVDLATDSRLATKERWTGILGQLLGSSVTIIDEGLGGRTTVRDDPYEPHRNGITYLPACLKSHEPLDMVIVMLGTNDLKRRFNTNAEDTARGISLICAEIKRVCTIHPVSIIVVSPAPFGEKVEPEEMWAAGIQESRRLAPLLEVVAAEHCAFFFDAGSVCTLNHGDGIHLSKADHQSLAEALHRIISALI